MTRNSVERLPNLGFGLGLRTAHFAQVLTKKPRVDLFEVVTENFLDTEGRPMDVLDEVARSYRVILHGVSLSIGSTDPLDTRYLTKVAALARRVDAPWVSDHVCWSSTGGVQMHDLLPLPYDGPTLRHVARRVKQVQRFLGRPLVLENPSTYLAFRQSTMTEWEFLARLTEATGCGLLLDVNNVYVSSVNHGFDANEYVDAIPRGRVVYFHLAGHTRYSTHLLDTHSDHVADPVWELYIRAQNRFGGRSTILEWDENIPEFPVVLRELTKAKDLLTREGRRAVRAAK
jgi:uncharacterized protein (UPF0276 family)